MCRPRDRKKWNEGMKKRGREGEIEGEETRLR
jgi:hypothetical protein